VRKLKYWSVKKAACLEERRKSEEVKDVEAA